MPAKSTTDMTNDKVGIKKPIFQRAKAYIVVHAGYAKRVCQKSSVNKPGLKIGDYDMNSTNYLRWIRSKMISNLPTQAWHSKRVNFMLIFCNLKIYFYPTSTFEYFFYPVLSLVWAALLLNTRIQIYHQILVL